METLRRERIRLEILRLVTEHTLTFNRIELLSTIKMSLDNSVSDEDLAEVLSEMADNKEIKVNELQRFYTGTTRN